MACQFSPERQEQRQKEQESEKCPWANEEGQEDVVTKHFKANKTFA